MSAPQNDAKAVSARGAERTIKQGGRVSASDPSGSLPELKIRHEAFRRKCALVPGRRYIRDCV